MYRSLRAAAVAALFALPAALGAVRTLTPERGAIHLLDGWAGKNPPRSKPRRYTEGELLIIRAARAERAARAARTGFLADFYNPTVSVDQMKHRHALVAA